MRANLSLLFYLKKLRNEKEGLMAIYLRITVDSRRTEMATGLKCEPEKWNAASGRMAGTKENVRSNNARLDLMHRKIFEIADRLERGDEMITAEGLKCIYLGKSTVDRMLLEVFEDHNRKAKALVGRDFAPGTIQRYETSLKHTREFLLSKYRLEDIAVQKVNHGFIAEYEFYLRSVRKCANNSTVKYLNNFKKIIRICQANGWITKDPFASHNLKVKPVDRTFLNDQELRALTEHDFGMERLNSVRDVFLFSCYTGLAYVDIQKLKHTELVTGPDGELWVQTKRQKTNTQSKIPLLRPALVLANKYSKDPRCKATGKVFPVSSNQKMNAYLKEIADVCKINKVLTYHIARHTFATTVTLSNGVSIESVSKMLGHTNIKTTQHYAKILDLKVCADMTAIKDKYI